MNRDNSIKNNKGFTILELIIVITISAIMVLFVGLTFGMINSTNVNKAAKNCEQALVQGRVQSMAKGALAGTAYFWYDNGNVYVKIGENGEKEKLCDSKIKAYFCQYSPTLKNITAYTEVSNMAPGEASARTFVFTNIGTVNKADSTINDYYYNGIMFERGNRRTVVYIYFETGKIELVTL